MACVLDVANEDIVELIVVKDETFFAPSLYPDGIYEIDGKYEIWYYNQKRLPPLSVRQFGYDAIPMCYGPVAQKEMEQTGVARLQSINTLSLRGQGVFVAIIDSGINYEDAAFRNPDGTTRIFSLWDQTADGQGKNIGQQGNLGWVGNVGQQNSAGQGVGSSRSSAELCYGRIYDRNQINEALFSGTPREYVPQRDEYGHGTFVASVACGSEDAVANFVGAAPESDLLVVKLKPAKKNLREFYGIPDSAVCYAETDIMAAVSYVNQIANREKKPMVILMSLGTSSGNHSGSGPLNGYLDTLALQIGRVIVAATGNEAAARRHYYGESLSIVWPERVEINVEGDMRTLCLELWSTAPTEMSVAIQSPTGERYPAKNELESKDGEFEYVLEGTTVRIARRFVGRSRRDQLVFIRFSNIVRGIWTIFVYPVGYATGNFHSWLPMTSMTEAEVYFLASNPNTTLTGPSDALNLITVGGFDGQNQGLYYASGRGYDASFAVKPDIVAPAVGIMGKNQFGNYETRSGTSGAAAICAGACAQILEWSINDGKDPGANSVDVKNRLIRGAVREENIEYPNPELGYGFLNVYDSIRIR